ncbi:hypothetical protein GSF22_21555, partial [Micromonospora echinofusca]|nr:hypothetical protein [Micromonospora echinofusca]
SPTGKPTHCPTGDPHGKDPHGPGHPHPGDPCPPHPPGPPHLPKTGTDTGPLLAAGGALLGTGTLLLLLSLRLRRRSA